MRPDFVTEEGTLPVVVQDVDSLRIVMVGVMREFDYNFTLGSGLLTLGYPQKKYSGIVMVGRGFLKVWKMWVAKGVEGDHIIIQIKFSSVTQRRKARRELAQFAPVRLKSKGETDA